MHSMTSTPQPRRTFSPVLAAMALALSLSACGFQGVVYERLPNGDIGDTLPDTTITFTKEGTSVTKTTTSGAGGAYKITLNKGRYVTTATHAGYEPYSSAPGFFVVTGTDGYQTGNFFLEQE